MALSASFWLSKGFCRGLQSWDGVFARSNFCPQKLFSEIFLTKIFFPKFFWGKFSFGPKKLDSIWQQEETLWQVPRKKRDYGKVPASRVKKSSSGWMCAQKTDWGTIRVNAIKKGDKTLLTIGQPPLMARKVRDSSANPFANPNRLENSQRFVW